MKQNELNQKCEFKGRESTEKITNVKQNRCVKNVMSLENLQPTSNDREGMSPRPQRLRKKDKVTARRQKMSSKCHLNDKESAWNENDVHKHIKRSARKQKNIQSEETVNTKRVGKEEELTKN